MEEWKKMASQLDKDHAKGTYAHEHKCERTVFSFLTLGHLEHKKAKADIKKKSSDTIKLQKKVKKGKDHHFSSASTQFMLFLSK